MSPPLLVALCALSAAFYVAAGAVMKVAGGLPFVLLLVPVLAALALAAWFESLALPASRFGMVALLILAFEVLIAFGAAAALGERYSGRELLGLVVIVAGIAIVYDANAARAASPPAAGAPQGAATSRF